MSSVRRTEIRNARRQHDKRIKRRDANGEMYRQAEKGGSEGKKIAFCVIANYLYDVYGFRKKRIEAFLEKCSMESTKVPQAGVEFVLKKYANMLLEKINNTGASPKVNGFMDHVFFCQRNEKYVTSIALMLTVLNDDYGMGSNKRSTGRLDEVVEYCTLEYAKIQKNPEKYNVEWYIKETRKRCGISMNY